MFYSGEPNEVLVVAASLPVDIIPARELNLASVWIEHPGTFSGNGGEGVPKDRNEQVKLANWTFETMDEFAEAMAIAKGH